jgi:C-terminal processing protease CtpA/Prc
VPILISELEPDGAAAKCGVLYVGDAILSANGKDLKQVTIII